MVKKFILLWFEFRFLWEGTVLPCVLQHLLFQLAVDGQHLGMADKSKGQNGDSVGSLGEGLKSYQPSWLQCKNPHFLNQKQHVNDSRCRKFVAAFVHIAKIMQCVKCRGGLIMLEQTNTSKRQNTPKNPRLCQTYLGKYLAFRFGWIRPLSELVCKPNCKNIVVTCMSFVFLHAVQSFGQDTSVKLNCPYKCYEWILFLWQTPVYLWIEDKVFGRAHVLGVGVRLEVNAGGVESVGVARDSRGHVGAGEIHVGVVGRLVQSCHVGAIHAEVWHVVVVWERAGHLGLLVDHLNKETIWGAVKRNSFKWGPKPVGFFRHRLKTSLRLLHCNNLL